MYNIVWTYVKDNIMKEKNQCEAIGLYGFGYKIFEADYGGGVR